MPVAVTYPGVYVEELPSGEHTISGVATSITAFVGRAVRGPTKEPITIFNFGDYERLFGGLQYDCPMGYAVQDFFMNGGSEAIIVRLYQEKASKPGGKATDEGSEESAKGNDTPKASLKIGELTLEAANPGAWGQYLSAWVDIEGITDQVAERYARFGVEKKDLFNLSIELQTPGGRKFIERFLNCSVTGKHAANRVDRVLEQQSMFMRVPLDNENNPTLPKSPPTPTKQPLDDNKAKASGGSDSDEPLDPKTIIGDEDGKTGIYMLKHVDLFNLLCIPPDQRASDNDISVNQAAMKFCCDRRAMLIVDSPVEWTSKANTGQIAQIDVADLKLTGEQSRNAAVYFPRVIKEDLEMGGQLDSFPACGIVAGVMASTDVTRGVWKAPAGEDAALEGIRGLNVHLTDAENGVLNPVGINCLRNFPIIGPVVWGARTLRGADALADDYKYVSVRRLTLYIEESLYRGTKWAVFEPNDEALWSQMRLGIGGFMAELSRQGAFYNYRVVCDATTTSPLDIENGIVNILVSFAPVKPAEFVVLQIQQQAARPA